MAQTSDTHRPLVVENDRPAEILSGAGVAPPDVEQHLRELDTLIGGVEPSTSDEAGEINENRLVSNRLGVAGGLFAALQCKHGATAAHSVRVAMGCSAWALAIDLPDEECDALEIAALLHDVGKVGVPDRILLKPGPLTPDEQAVMDRHQQMGLDILQACCNVPEVLETVRYAGTWFDGSRGLIDRKGTQLPRAARMLAIVNAFDSMTTAQVYRPAMSDESAFKELYECAGTQFDAQLAHQFVELQATDRQKLHHRVARRWLHQIQSEDSGGWWQLRSGPAGQAESDSRSLYAQKLLENMYDAVIFLDVNMQVMLWNHGAERLTGINGSSMLQRPLLPSVLSMRDERGNSIADSECPVAYAVRTGVQSLRRLTICGRDGRDTMVDAHTIPVLGPGGGTQGASLLLHDASGQASLEERCHSLYELATRDPLTQLANRAEFDRVFSLFVNVHQERRLPCSLIICDIDHFKLVNDTYGHQAGDEVIKSFAQLMKSSCRPGDLVARYGGEEFVILCADCNNSVAAARAEELRKAFATFPIPILNCKSCSASFGVTEIQPGDTSETMLNRADRALLMAKQGGRNLVVQLGSGMSGESTEVRRRWWFWGARPGSALLDRYLVTNVPLNITVEKLRGFVSDHTAEVTSIEGHRVEMVIQPGQLRLMRRKSDRPLPMIAEIEFTQQEVEAQNSAGLEGGTVQQTKIHVVIRPKKNRDRRRAEAVEQAQRVLAALRSYLMANDALPDNDEGVFKKAGSLLTPWRGKQIL